MVLAIFSSCFRKILYINQVSRHFNCKICEIKYLLNMWTFHILFGDTMSKYFRPTAGSKLLDQISNNLTRTSTKLLTNSLPILASKCSPCTTHKLTTHISVPSCNLVFIIFLLVRINQLAMIANKNQVQYSYLIN